MPQIVVENLVKRFRVAERAPGMLGAIKGIVSRRYKTVTALDGVSFNVNDGELLGYIGPNGAGKSTTVKILSGILVPEEGSVKVLGRTPWVERVKTVGHIGVVFGQRTQLWWDLPVIESFELLRDIYRVDEAQYRRTKDELIDLMNLSAFLDTPVRQLSLGQRMRCDLTASLLHNPKILFLDEPTIGLDASSKIAVRDFIVTLNRERGVTVILTTHDMDDIEVLCSRVLVINEGKILSDGTIGNLRSLVTNERRLTIILGDGDVDVQVTDPEAEVIERDGRRITLKFDPDKTPPAELIGRIAANYTVRDLFVENPPIEEIIAEIYRSCQT